MAPPLCLEALSDCALLDRLALAVRHDREHTRLVLELIDVVDRRKLWAKQGYSSLFAFCVGRFRMSEGTAAKRIRAARCARRFPALLEMVARGELHLSGIHRLAAHLTPDNHHAVLGRAKHGTLKQIDVLVRELAPQPDVPSSVRKLPERRIGSQASPVATSYTIEVTTEAAPAAQPPLEPTPTRAGPATGPATGAAPRLEPVEQAGPTRRSPDPRPLSPGRYKLQVTLGERAHQTLRQLQDLLAHQIATGDPAVIVERALEVLLAQTLKKKAALTEQPRARKPGPPASAASATSPRSRDIPARIRREVWQREQGSCSFVGADGKPCGETRGLEFAHRRPWAKGGEHSADNLALRCKPHNALEADRDYGEAFMRRKRERGPAHVEIPAQSQAQPFRVSEPRMTYGRGQANVHAPRMTYRRGRARGMRAAHDVRAWTSPNCTHERPCGLQWPRVCSGLTVKDKVLPLERHWAPERSPASRTIS